MNILIACEESQRVCNEFRIKGHNAFSCDILEPSGNHPEWHILSDVLPLLNGNCEFITMDNVKHIVNGKWDMIIAFPPCTYMTTASACRMYPQKGIIDKERYKKMIDAREFFMAIYNSDCEKIAIENPTPLKICNLPKCTQVIQPYMFGEPYSKRTCLWLKGLPMLRPTKILDKYTSFVNAGSKDSKGNKRKNIGVAFSAIERSKTFLGIAKAMADQWS